MASGFPWPCIDIHEFPATSQNRSEARVRFHHVPHKHRTMTLDIMGHCREELGSSCSDFYHRARNSKELWKAMDLRATVDSNGNVVDLNSRPIIFLRYSKNKTYLVGGLTLFSISYMIIYGIILPIDELIFFKMVIAPPTRYCFGGFHSQLSLGFVLLPAG